MADTLVFLFTVSTFMSVLCLITVFSVSWYYESMFMELTTRTKFQELKIIEFKRTGAVSSTDNSQGTGIVKGVSFTRWGNNKCPGVTELVYNGIMVNELDDNNIPQCLPLDPTHTSKLKAQELLQKTTDHQNYSMPCVVCYSNRHSTVLTQPGSHVCASGWAMLYEGLFVANEASHLCMDIAVRSLQESPHARGMSGYHYVKVSCDVLPCPPYSDKSSLTCAMCIK